MKINLRQLIREELTSFLQETPESDNANKKTIEAKKAQIAALQKELAQLQKGGIMNEEEESLNEMPFLTGEKGEELFDAIKSSAESIKSKFPEASAGDIAKIILSKKKRPEFAPEVQTALDNQIEKYGGDPNYTDTLGGPQTLRAVEKALGLSTPGQKGRKPNPDKPESKSKETKAKEEKPKSTPSKSIDKEDEAAFKMASKVDSKLGQTYATTKLSDEERELKKWENALARVKSEGDDEAAARIQKKINQLLSK